MLDILRDKVILSAAASLLTLFTNIDLVLKLIIAVLTIFYILLKIFNEKKKWDDGRPFK